MASAPTLTPTPTPGTQAPPGMMQQATDPLAALRDIQAPGPIETWPPAIGWWLLAGIALIALVGLAVWLYRRWRNNRYRREALAELRSLYEGWQNDRDDRAYLNRLQQLLKRVALTSFPRESVASLTGEAWVQFLDRSTGSHDFSMAESEALIDGSYRNDIEIDVEGLQATASAWIKNHDPRHFEQSEEEPGDVVEAAA